MYLLQILSSGRSLLYSQKRVVPKMECYGKPAFMGNFCVDFSSMSNQHNLWTVTWISIRLKFVSKSSVPNPARNLALSNATAALTPHMLKALIIYQKHLLKDLQLNEKICQHIGIQKKDHDNVINKPIIYELFTDFLTN